MHAFFDSDKQEETKELFPTTPLPTKRVLERSHKLRELEDSLRMAYAIDCTTEELALTKSTVLPSNESLSLTRVTSSDSIFLFPSSYHSRKVGIRYQAVDSIHFFHFGARPRRSPALA